jgi:CDP-glycerol glycerophosphotransferase
MRAGVRLLRSLRRAPSPARRPAARVPGRLSVVVVVAGDPPVAECLDSLRAQRYAECEVLVVDVGAGPVALAAVEARAREDPRVRVLRHPGGLGAGRNRGAAEASGEFLAFLDADDVVTPAGYARAIDALRGSGSDLAVTSHRPYRRGHTLQVDERVRALHATRRTATTIGTFPDALGGTLTGTRVLRREWYAETGLSFAEDLRACDDLHSVRAYTEAATFDVLPHVGLLRRVDLDRSPLTRHAPDPEGLATWWAGLEAALTALPPLLAAVAAAEAMAGPLVPFTDRAWRCPDDYWAALVDVVTHLRARAGEQARPRVPAYQKAVTRLVADGDRDGVRRLLTEVRPTARRYPTELTVLDDRPAVLVDLGPDRTGLQPADRVLAAHETAVRAEVTSVADLGEGRLELRGWAYLDNIDLSDRSRALALSLRSGGACVGLEVADLADPAADVASDLWWADVTRSGFSAVVDCSALDDGAWEVHTSVTVGGLSGSARLRVRPGVLAGVPSWTDTFGRRWHLDQDDSQQVVLRGRRTPWPEVALSVEDDVLRVGFPAPVRSATLDAPGAAPVAGTGDGSGFTFPLGDLDGGRRWTLRAVAEDGATYAVPWPATGPDDVRVRPSRRGTVTVARARVEAVAASLEDETLVVRLRLRAAEVAEVALLVGDHATAGQTRLEGDVLVATLSLAASRWGGPALPLRSGTYAVAARRAGGEWSIVAPGDELCRALPLESLGERMQLRVEAFGPEAPGLRVAVGPPHADDERGQRHQRLLREASRVAVADRDSVFFRAMFGEHAHGNGLGVHEELVRRGAGLELLWSVQDRSVPVPPGGVGVVERSRAWHEAVARSRYQVVDVHQLEWFVRPEGQTLVQTFHGYPYKVMGHDWWEKMGNLVQEIGSLDRRTRDWSALISPAPYATPLLRHAFLEPAGADVPVLELGYPRNDVLLRPEAADLRARTRALLGLDDDTVAVLYAPTFRDYLSPEDRTARSVDFFDVAEALDLLPDRYVVLMRGHAFNARVRTDRPAPSVRMVDVTDHPDVNHLVLASDVGVLDYSSLRFDYVLCGNPMVFLVPDLAEYDAARGGVIPFAPTAPGPHVSTTREVVEWVRDLPRLVAEYADARARFRADYVGLEDGASAARLVDALFVPRGDG